MNAPVVAQVPYSPDYEYARNKGELVTVDDLAVKHGCSKQTITNAIKAGELSAFQTLPSQRGQKYYVFADSAQAWPGPKAQRGEMRAPASRGGMATKAARESDDEPEPCDTSTCAGCSMRVWCVGVNPAMPWRRRAMVMWRAMEAAR